jgi:hypothetical protein
MSFKKQLMDMDACHQAVSWVGDRTLTEAWSECQRGDWMIWGLAMMAGQPGWPCIQKTTGHVCRITLGVIEYIPYNKMRQNLYRIIDGALHKRPALGAHITKEDIDSMIVMYELLSPEKAAIRSAGCLAECIDSTFLPDKANDMSDAVFWAAAAHTNASKGELECELKSQADYLRMNVSIPEVAS